MAYLNMLHAGSSAAAGVALYLTRYRNTLLERVIFFVQIPASLFGTLFFIVGKFSWTSENSTLKLWVITRLLINIIINTWSQ